MKKQVLLWFNSLGAAYDAANAATRMGAEILELFPFATRGHLFLQMPKDLNLELMFSSISVKPDNLEVFNSGLTENVMKAYLSLSNPPLAEDILICEHTFLGDALRIATQAERNGLQILDIRFLRDASGFSFVMATGNPQQCHDFIHQMLPQMAKVRHIKNPTEALREFFPKNN